MSRPNSLLSILTNGPPSVTMASQSKNGAAIEASSSTDSSNGSGAVKEKSSSVFVDVDFLSDSGSESSTGCTYDKLLAKFYKDMQDVKAADEQDLKNQELIASKMKANLEKKKRKVMDRVNKARLEVGQRVGAAPTAKNPRQALARETYLENLDKALTAKEQEGKKANEEIETKLRLVDKRIERRRRQSDDLISSLTSQAAMQEEAAREREANEERNEMLDLATLEENLQQGLSPPVAMPATTAIKEKERKVRQAQLLRDIRDMRTKYAMYMKEVERDRKKEADARRALRSERDAAIMSGEQPKNGRQPTVEATDPPPASKKGHASAQKRKVARKKQLKVKAADNAVSSASYSIAAFIMDWRIANCEVVPDADTDVDLDSLAVHQRKSASEVASPAAEDIIHEVNLEAAILPDRLRAISISSGETHVQVDDGAVPDHDTSAHARVTKSIAKAVLEQNYKVMDKLALMSRIQHLHSLALLHCINVTKTTRDVMVAGTGVDEEVQKLLKDATKATLLASDADLQSIPFNDIQSMLHFVSSRPKIEKLCNYLITYLDYDKYYVQNMVFTLFTPELQGNVYWSGRAVTPGGYVYMIL